VNTEFVMTEITAYMDVGYARTCFEKLLKLL